MFTVTKVKPMPAGHWYQKSKWDILRAMRESSDFIAVVRDEKGTVQMKTKSELAGERMIIGGVPYSLQEDGSVSRIQDEVTISKSE